MISNEIQYPVYRRTSDGRHYYQIKTAELFLEIQLVGSRAVLHRIEAALYPERLRVQDMIEGVDGHFLPSDAAVWTEVLEHYGLHE